MKIQLLRSYSCMIAAQVRSLIPAGYNQNSVFVPAGTYDAVPFTATIPAGPDVGQPVDWWALVGAAQAVGVIRPIRCDQGLEPLPISDLGLAIGSSCTYWVEEGFATDRGSGVKLILESDEERQLCEAVQQQIRASKAKLEQRVTRDSRGL